MGKPKRKQSKPPPVENDSPEASRSAGKNRKKDLKKNKARTNGVRTFCDSSSSGLEQQLATVGLRVKEVTADGNCFFRALSDQIKGHECNHEELRKLVLEHVEEERELYEPFVEDDEPFLKYCSRMRKDGTWAGHIELQAASLALKSNIAVYQAGQPCWTIKNFADSAPTLHLAYHDGQHYNSVRLADDYGQGPPQPIKLSVSTDPASTKMRAGRVWGAKEAAAVAAGTGCDCKAAIERALEDSFGAVDEAIELLIQRVADGMADDEHVQGIGTCTSRSGSPSVGLHGIPEAGSSPRGSRVTSSDPAQRMHAAPGQGSRALSSTSMDVPATPSLSAVDSQREVAPATVRLVIRSLYLGGQSDSCLVTVELVLPGEPSNEAGSSSGRLQTEPSAAAVTAGSDGDIWMQKGHGQHVPGGHAATQAGTCCSKQVYSEEIPALANYCGATSCHGKATGEGSGGDGGAIVGHSQQAENHTEQQQQQQEEVEDTGDAQESGGGPLEQQSLGGISGKGRKGVRLKKGGGDGRGSAGAKLPSRNKACPCGSKQKYKNCCGAKKRGQGRAGGEEMVDQQQVAESVGDAVGQLQTLYI